MIRQLLKNLARPLRTSAGKFVIIPESEDGNYIGQHGCINAAASFTAWNQIEGDYLEFGVYRGDSFAAAYRAIMRNRQILIDRGKGSRDYVPGDQTYEVWKRTHPRFFAFDSFEGLPDQAAERMADYAAGAYSCTEEQFKRNLAKQGVDLKDVITVPGFYDKSLTPAAKARLNLRKAAVVMIDCDLYESTIPVLDFITDLLGQGSVIIFDDWFRFRGSPKYGEQRACREWLERNTHFELIEHWRQGPQAMSFLVNFK